MPTAPKKPRRPGEVVTRPAKILTVYSSVWRRGRKFIDRKGEDRIVETYQEARDYATANGYRGIQVEYQ